MSKRFKAVSTSAALAAVAFVSIAVLAPQPVFAQTMGEYGMATGHAAASASQVPAIQAAAPSIESLNSGGGGSTHTMEIRGYDAPSRANDRQDKDDDTSDSGNSSQDWVQVK
jgi:hypothetical protein